MTDWEMVLFAALLVVAGMCVPTLSWRRRIGWLAAGAASDVFGTLWWSYDLPYHPFATAMGDAAICLLVFLLGRYKWELRLFLVFQISVLISIMAFISEVTPYQIIGSAYGYALALELCNWAAMIVIGAGPLWELGFRGDSARWHPGSGIHGALRTVFAQKCKSVEVRRRTEAE